MGRSTGGCKSSVADRFFVSSIPRSLTTTESVSRRRSGAIISYRAGMEKGAWSVTWLVTRPEGPAVTGLAGRTPGSHGGGDRRPERPQWQGHAKDQEAGGGVTRVPSTSPGNLPGPPRAPGWVARAPPQPPGDPPAAP